MVSPEKCDRLAQKIHRWVMGVLDAGGNEEQLMEEMYDYMGLCRDTCKKVQNDLQSYTQQRF